MESIETARLRPPGSDWLYLKLYGPKTLQDDLLRRYIEQWNSIVFESVGYSRWFFIRLADPESHVRIRYHGMPDDLLTALGNLSSGFEDALSERTVTSIEMATYDREVERYGGISGLGICEKIFCASSEFALSVNADSPDPQQRFLLAVASVDALVAHFAGDIEERQQFFNRLRPKARHDYAREFRPIREDVVRALEKGRGRAVINSFDARVSKFSDSVKDPMFELYELDQSGNLQGTLADILPTLIHVHCNRLLGTERADEMKLLVALQKGLQILQHKPPTPVC